MIPFLLLVFSNPSEKSASGKDAVKLFFNCLTVIAIINNIVGFIQVILRPVSDDNFTGIYSTFSISLSGLVLLNAIIFYYYYSLYSLSSQRKHLIAALFFLACSIMGFYGAGLIILITAFVLSVFRFRLIAIFKTIIISLLVVAAVYYLLLLLKPSALDYNIANLEKIASFDIQNGPRKLTSFYNYAISYPSNLKDFLFGSGPGTFNSRSAFMVGSPSYFSAGEILKSENKPYYFENYAYTLWNENNTSQALFQDGFRNQPFSSLLAFMGEYGFIFFIAFAGSYYALFRRVSACAQKSDEKISGIYFRFFRFLFILLPLLLLIDNFLEYPEIILLIGVSMKLLHIELYKKSQHQPLTTDNA